MIEEKTGFHEVCDEADIAGLKAVQELTVIPMIVGETKNLFSNDIDYSKSTEYIEDGPCGFSWVSVKPKHKGNTRLGKEERAELEEMGLFKNEYTKTYQLWISQFNQSIQKKEAYARAFSKVLQQYGYNAIPGSRLD